jgi:mRNA interferase RelE/StbE
MGPSRHKLKMPDDTAAVVRSLHPNLKRKVKSALSAIMNDPHAGKALKDELEGLQSFRVGKFRIVYGIKNKERIIEVIAIGPRKIIYEETLRLVKK